MESLDTTARAIESWLWTVVLVQAAICAILSGVVAKAKERDAGMWSLIGLFCGVFGLIAIAGMPVARTREEAKNEAATEVVETPSKSWNCRCGHTRIADDEECPKCGRSESEGFRW